MAFSEDLMSKCSEHLSAYKSACEEHPNLKTFNSSLVQRTNKVIDSLADESKTKSKSPYAVHKEVSEHLLEVTEGVTKFITEGDYNVSESEALHDLVEAYFESTKETLKIFNTIEDCVEDAEMGQLLIRQAVAEFEKESAEKKKVGGKKKYEKTLKNLMKFRAKKGPFDGHVLTTQFEEIDKQQKTLLDKVCEAKKKIKAEIANREHDIFITHAVFGAAVAIVIVTSVIVIATAGTGVAAVAGFAALGGPLLAAGWAGVYSTLNSKKESLKKQLEGLQKLDGLASDVKDGIKTNQAAMGTVSTLVDGLEDSIENMLELVDNAIENEDNEAATRLVLQAISGRVEKLTEEIKEVGESVREHRKLISQARLHVLQKLNSSG